MIRNTDCFRSLVAQAKCLTSGNHLILFPTEDCCLVVNTVLSRELILPTSQSQAEQELDDMEKTEMEYQLEKVQVQVSH